MTKWLFVFFFALASCGHKSKQRVPPKELPEEVFWIGDKQGGYWYLVHQVHPHRNNAYITIYNDRDGKLVISKKFILYCTISENYNLIEDIKSQILGFDGKTIKFKSSDGKSVCVLK